MLPCLVSVLLTFEIQGVLKFEKKSVAKRLSSTTYVAPAPKASKYVLYEQLFEELKTVL